MAHDVLNRCSVFPVKGRLDEPAIAVLAPTGVNEIIDNARRFEATCTREAYCNYEGNVPLSGQPKVELFNVAFMFLGESMPSLYTEEEIKSKLSLEPVLRQVTTEDINPGSTFLVLYVGIEKPDRVTVAKNPIRPRVVGSNVMYVYYYSGHPRAECYVTLAEFTGWSDRPMSTYWVERQPSTPR